MRRQSTYYCVKGGRQRRWVTGESTGWVGVAKVPGPVGSRENHRRQRDRKRVGRKVPRLVSVEEEKPSGLKGRTPIMDWKGPDEEYEQVP